jgi:transcription-repair coupling factor (superfamily II helicase)
MTTLSLLANGAVTGAVVLTTVNGLIQKLPPREVVAGMAFAAAAGQVVDNERLIGWAAGNGYLRVPTVRETGEFAVRGGLIDIFPAGREAPLRFDFFGRQLETIRTFDPDTQRTTGNLKSVALAPMSEVLLDEATIRRFRANYTGSFGGNTSGDPLYAAISAGQRYPGFEHWMAFFYEKLDRLSAYVGAAPFVLDYQASEAIADRQEQIADK